MKIGVISDVHGNLQALTAALRYLKEQNCNEIIHTGDVVDIGAQSAECLDALTECGAVCILGNHDKDFVEGADFHKPFSHVSGRHKKHVFASLRGREHTVAEFPLYVQRNLGGKKVIFEHYCRLNRPTEDGYVFKSIVHFPTAEIFDEMYRDYKCDAVFFGHKHEPCDVMGSRLYVDVGSVGCHPQPFATGVIITYDQNSFGYRRFSVPYDMEKTRRLMTESELPDGKYLFDFYFMHKKLPFAEE